MAENTEPQTFTRNLRQSRTGLESGRYRSSFPPKFHVFDMRWLQIGIYCEFSAGLKLAQSHLHTRQANTSGEMRKKNSFIIDWGKEKGRSKFIYILKKELNGNLSGLRMFWANFGHRNGHVLYFTQSSSSARKHEDNKFSTLLRGSGEESLISVSPYLYIGLWWIYFVVRYIRLGVCLGRAANWRCREFQ